MGDQPPPPQVSPDGRFYWDGQAWRPIPTHVSQAAQPAAVVVPAGYELRRQSHTGRNLAIGCLGIIGVFILIGVIGALAGPPKTTVNSGVSEASATPSVAASRSPAASPSPVGPKTLLSKSASGINTTAKFTAAGDWQILWSYDCSSFGYEGNFQVYVYDDNGDLVDIAVNELGNKGSNATWEHQGGTYYLQINSECNWNVIVKG